MFMECSDCLDKSHRVIRSCRRCIMSFCIWVVVIIGSWTCTIDNVSSAMDKRMFQSMQCFHVERDKYNCVGMWKTPPLGSASPDVGYDPADGRRMPIGGESMPVPMLMIWHLRRKREELVLCELNAGVQLFLRLMYREMEDNLENCLKSEKGLLEALNGVAQSWFLRQSHVPDKKGLRLRVLDFYVLYRHVQLQHDADYRSLWRYVNRTLLQECKGRQDYYCKAQRAIFRAVVLYEIQLSNIVEKNGEWVCEHVQECLSWRFFGRSYERLAQGLCEQVDRYAWMLKRHWYGYVAEAKVVDMVS